MKNVLTILFITLSCLFANAQISRDSIKQVQSGLTDVEFQKAIDAYLKMTETQTYKSNRKASLLMMEKLNHNITKSMINDEDWSKWVPENLTKTKFKSVEEANNLRKLNLELTKKQFEENAELYEMIRRASPEQAHEIFRPERAGRPF